MKTTNLYYLNFPSAPVRDSAANTLRQRGMNIPPEAVVDWRSNGGWSIAFADGETRQQAEQIIETRDNACRLSLLRQVAAMSETKNGSLISWELGETDDGYDTRLDVLMALTGTLAVTGGSPDWRARFAEQLDSFSKGTTLTKTEIGQLRMALNRTY